MSASCGSVSDTAIDAVQHVARTVGPGALVVDDLRQEDLASLAWSGNPEHLRSVARALKRVALGEDDNPRARALYQRLGYLAWRHPTAAWHYEDDQGVLRRYETELTWLRKRL